MIYRFNEKVIYGANENANDTETEIASKCRIVAMVYTDNKRIWWNGRHVTLRM